MGLFLLLRAPHFSTGSKRAWPVPGARSGEIQAHLSMRQRPVDCSIRASEAGVGDWVAFRSWDRRCHRCCRTHCAPLHWRGVEYRGVRGQFCGPWYVACGMVSSFLAAECWTRATFCPGLAASMIAAVIDFCVSRIANIGNGSGLETAHVSVRPVETSTSCLAIACGTQRAVGAELFAEPVREESRRH